MERTYLLQRGMRSLGWGCTYNLVCGMKCLQIFLLLATAPK